MRKIFFLVGLVLVFSLSALAQNVTWPRFEINFLGGYGLTQFKGDSVYSNSWNYNLLQSVQENTTLSMKADNNVFFTAGISYFFKPNIGIQLGLGYFSPKPSISGKFSSSWKWTTSSTVYTDKRDWTGDSKLSTVPLYLNLIGKYRSKMLDLFVSAGPALFFNSFEANSFVGLMDSYYYSIIIWPYQYTFQYVDVFKVPVSIKTSWMGFGGNVGFGFDFKVSPSVSVTAEGRYFLAPVKSLPWEWTPGTYDGLFGTITQWKLTASNLQAKQDKMTAVDVKSSFFSFGLGIRFALGQK